MQRLFRAAFIALVHALASYAGFRAATEAPTGLPDLLVSVGLAFGVVFACIVDSTIIAKRMVHIVPFVMLFTWPLSAPIYLVWSRGWKGLILTLVFAATMFIACLIPIVSVVAVRD
jgi:hypothetical protein